jgi:hypothetical protein
MTLSEWLDDLWARYVDAANWREDGDRLSFAWGGYRVAIAWHPGVDMPDDAEDWIACEFDPSGWAWSVHAVDGELIDCGSHTCTPTIVEAKVTALDHLVSYLRSEADTAAIEGPILRVVP